MRAEKISTGCFIKFRLRICLYNIAKSFLQFVGHGSFLTGYDEFFCCTLTLEVYLYIVSHSKRCHFAGFIIHSGNISVGDERGGYCRLATVSLVLSLCVLDDV